MRRVSLVLALIVAACGTPKPPADVADAEAIGQATPSNDEKPGLPPYPDAKRLLQFGVVETPGFRFFIDPVSLSVDKDGVVRYTLVARSDEGAENVTYEGVHCASAKMRVYAVGISGAWSGRATPWRDPATRWHRSLYQDYFCPQAKPIRNARDGIYALELGRHPDASVAGDPGGH